MMLCLGRTHKAAFPWKDIIMGYIKVSKGGAVSVTLTSLPRTVDKVPLGTVVKVCYPLCQRSETLATV